MSRSTKRLRHASNNSHNVYYLSAALYYLPERSDVVLARATAR